MNFAVVIQVFEDKNRYRSADESDKAEHFKSGIHCRDCNKRMKAYLLSDNFRLDYISDNENDDIYYKKSYS